MGGDRVPLHLRNVPYASMARWKVKRITTGKKEAPSGLSATTNYVICRGYPNARTRQYGLL